MTPTQQPTNTTDPLTDPSGTIVAYEEMLNVFCMTPWVGSFRCIFDDYYFYYWLFFHTTSSAKAMEAPSTASTSEPPSSPISCLVQEARFSGDHKRQDSLNKDSSLSSSSPMF
jgi:hypothetical protein